MENKTKSVLKQIFIYHDLDNSTELKQLWVNDLQNFTTAEIQAAWDVWRKNEFNNLKKPKSWDLVKIIRSQRETKFFLSTKIGKKEVDELIQGKDFSTDCLIENLKTMKKNMPHFEEAMKSTKNIFEKIYICASALNKPELTNSVIMRDFLKKSSFGVNA